jgi:PKD repeat protein
LILQGSPDITVGIAPTYFTSGVQVFDDAIVFESGAYKVNTDVVPSGLYDVTYTFTNTSGGTSTRTRFVKVLAAPLPLFTINNFCVDSPISFTDNSTMSLGPYGGNIVAWDWDFGDNSFSPDKDPFHTYSSEGVYDITLTVTTDQGCQATVQQSSIKIGAVPFVDFTSSAFCEGDSTRFTAKWDFDVQDPSVVTTIDWDFGDGSNDTRPGTNPEIAHLYSVSNRYTIAMDITTAEGCIATDIQDVDVFPLKTFDVSSTSEYYEDFELVADPQGGWFEGANFENDSISWEFGTPSGTTINSASSGTNAWWTGSNTNPNQTYFDGEQSFVNGPCFDLTNLERPMVSIDIWDDNQEGFDGASLEFSIDGGQVWQPIGEIDQGINWYNDAGILGAPGGKRSGWSQNTDGWLTARYTLEQIIDRDLVRFRIAFGSNDDNPVGESLNGFAFDNVNIRDRDRVVLVENFTNLNQQPLYDNVRTKMLAIDALRPMDFIYLNYHIPHPDDSDSLYRDNRSEPQTRANTFGISQSINTAFDGNEYLGPALGWDLEKLDSRSLVDPEFNITLDIIPSSEDSISVRWEVEALREVDNPIIVHTVVIEDEILLSNGSSAYNVVKKMLPNPGGSSREDLISFVPGDTYSTAQLDWPIDVRLYDGSKLTVVVFVQERTDGGTPGEIYQVAYESVPGNKKSPVITSIDDELELIANSISIYPNPVLDDLHFLTTDRPSEHFNWKIVDQRGVTLMKDDFNFINGEYTVDTSEIPNGIYYLIIAAEDQPLSYEKLIIMHR